ncbi:MAG TPA: helix-turn-helix domain-containing protein [Ohtaekwangia sp.]|nr:helix-turn-helix domain-containing protein [Ohtaekwangia sp.]
MLQQLVITWLFFSLTILAQAQVTFVIDDLPRATSATDTIFICGSFNNWVTNDPACAVKRQLNGQLSVTVHATGIHEYKFTRGNWMKVETDPGNDYIRNRSVAFDGRPTVVRIRIENWLDLGGARTLNYIVFYFFACAFQGIALCLLVYRIDKKDPLKFRAFLISTGSAIALLVLLVLFETANPVWQAYYVFFFRFSLFCWGPSLLYFVYRFSGQPLPRMRWYFVPAMLVALVICIRLLNIPAASLLTATWGTFLFVTVGFLFNLSVGLLALHRFPVLKIRPGIAREARDKFLFYYFWISAVALLSVPLNLALLSIGLHHPFIADFENVAVVLTTLIFLKTYFLWRYPEMIREEKGPAVHPDNLGDLLAKLEDTMTALKPYKNPELNISDLAELVGTKPHVLSRVINDTYHRNFRDFVNAYRIEEFIRLADTRKFRHFTFLALAQEVGFNSKSTFNLAFKKLTHLSPSAYFKSKGLQKVVEM